MTRVRIPKSQSVNDLNTLNSKQALQQKSAEVSQSGAALGKQNTGIRRHNKYAEKYETPASLAIGG